MLKSLISSALGFRWVVLIGLAALEALVLGSAPVQAQPAGSPLPDVRRAIKSDVSPPLRSISPVAPSTEELREIPLYPLANRRGRRTSGPQFQGVDPALQAMPPIDSMPDPIQNFEGVNNRNGVLPP